MGSSYIDSSDKEKLLRFPELNDSGQRVEGRDRGVSQLTAAAQTTETDDIPEHVLKL